MKKLSLFIFVLISCIPVYAQKKMSIERLEDGVYSCEDRKEFMAIFRCSNDMQLSFTSDLSMGEYNDIIRIEEDSIGTEVEYKLVFPTELTGKMSLNKRNLTVYCEGFDPYILTQFNDQPKICRIYKVSDPYVIMQNPFYATLQKASGHFQAGNYNDAKVQYNIAKQAPEYSTENDERALIDSRLEIIDSLIIWREKADDAYRRIKYVEAMTLYGKILKLNPNDIYVMEQNRACINDHSTNCNNYYKTAEELFNNNNLSEAEIYYQRVIDADCSFKSLADDKLRMIETVKENRKNKNNFFSYEYHKDVPIAFSVGTCNFNKWGGYFTLRTNGDIFKLARMEPELDMLPEANISFGWTHKIVAPIWIHFGPGYTGIGQYTMRQSGIEKLAEDPNDELELDDYSFKWFNAVSPEAGIMFKMWHVNVRYTFQYRFALKSAHEEIIGKTRHYIAIGFAW